MNQLQSFVNYFTVILTRRSTTMYASALARCDCTIAPPLNLERSLRYFSSKEYYKSRKKNPTRCPFQVLGLVRTEEMKFVSVKTAFLKIAMKHHPDTAKSETAEDSAKHQEMFVNARKAFEEIVEGPHGIAILKSESDKYQEEDMDVWFKNETGFDMPYMDAATMKEVAAMTESIGGGLDRDGGMWTLARMVTDSVKSGGNACDILALEAGTSRDRRINGIIRRRRRR